MRQALKEPYMNNPRRNRGFRCHTTILSSEGAEYVSYGKYFSSILIPETATKLNPFRVCYHGLVSCPRLRRGLFILSPCRA